MKNEIKLNKFHWKKKEKAMMRIKIKRLCSLKSIKEEEENKKENKGMKEEVCSKEGKIQKEGG